MKTKKPRLFCASLHLLEEILYFFFNSSATSMPDPAKMSKNGMVTKIHTRIRAEPFTANYELVGKELGR